MEELNEMEMMSEESMANTYKLQGLDLILKSIKCEKYKSTFVHYGINEHTMRHLTADDLQTMNVDKNDIDLLLKAIYVLNKTLNLSKVHLSNEDISKIQNNVCGHLASIALLLNYIYKSIETNHLDDILIDNYLSSYDAALMIKPFMKEEEKQIEKTLKTVFKVQKKKSTVLITTSLCAVIVIGFVLRRFNYSFNFVPLYFNIIS